MKKEELVKVEPTEEVVVEGTDLAEVSQGKSATKYVIFGVGALALTAGAAYLVRYLYLKRKAKKAEATAETVEVTE